MKAALWLSAVPFVFQKSGYEFEAFIHPVIPDLIVIQNQGPVPRQKVSVLLLQSPSCLLCVNKYTQTCITLCIIRRATISVSAPLSGFLRWRYIFVYRRFMLNSCMCINGIIAWYIVACIPSFNLYHRTTFYKVFLWTFFSSTHDSYHKISPSKFFHQDHYSFLITRICWPRD